MIMIFKMQESKLWIEQLGISFFMLKFSSEMFLDQSEICASYTAGFQTKKAPETQIYMKYRCVCGCRPAM